MAAKGKMEIHMVKDKETKNALRFTEAKTGDDPHTKSIYLTKKECEEAGIGEEIDVVITPA